MSVLIAPQAPPLGISIHSLVYSVHTPGIDRYKITTTYTGGNFGGVECRQSRAEVSTHKFSQATVAAITWLTHNWQ